MMLRELARNFTLLHCQTRNITIHKILSSAIQCVCHHGSSNRDCLTASKHLRWILYPYLSFKFEFLCMNFVATPFHIYIASFLHLTHTRTNSMSLTLHKLRCSLFTQNKWTCGATKSFPNQTLINAIPTHTYTTLFHSPKITFLFFVLDIHPVLHHRTL